ncbi:MAG: serine/threonine-protein phosphatase [Rhodobacteraceae bacterium]|nr:serine/threonine-protein phosphatase [Paracoccaceae bacterium]
MTANWAYADVQTIGERANQEDFCRAYAQGDQLLCVLADGMGGHAAGEIASKMVVDKFIDIATAGSSTSWSEYFLNAIDSANNTLSDAVRQNPELEGMGTTLVAAEFREAEVRWLSIGDSTLYLFSGGNLRRLNADHSMGARLDTLVKSGEITQEQANKDPSRHMLLSAITGDQLGLMDYTPKGIHLSPGDIIVLASDGLDTLPLDDLCSRLERYRKWNPSDIARALISAVAKKGAPRQDNTTVMVVKFKPDQI